MQIHQLNPNKKKKKRRVGRGGKRGTYSGRGQGKKQKDRAGRTLEPIIRRAIKRYPKLRGYRFKARDKATVLNLKDLEKNFKEGETVKPSLLAEKGLVKKGSSVKILANGKLEKKLNFEDCLFSQSAKEKIEKAGGTICGTKK